MFFEPSCLARMFFIPANSNTILVDPPAITPDPVADGLNIIVAAPDLPCIGCGIDEYLVKGICIIFFLHL